MPSFKDEHVLMIAPGSSITQTQLGLPETFTPPRWRFPTRMFPGLTEGEWEPVFIRERVKIKPQPQLQPEPQPQPQPEAQPQSLTNGATTNGESKDVEMADATAVPPATTDPVAPLAPTNPDEAQVENRIEALPSDSTGAVQPIEPQPDTTTEEQETEFYDDPLTVANAVYPVKAGRIENWPCFFALLSHIYNMISPPFHMPVLVVAQPCWTARDKEWITQYFFENWKIPALCVMDSALAATWGFGVSTACVVDVGQDKCDISAVTEYVVNDVGRGVAIEGCGGKALTARLREELEKSPDKYRDIEDLTEFAEQLKRSQACEILGPGISLPGAAANGSQEPQPPVIADGKDNLTQVVPQHSDTLNGDSEHQDGDDHEGVLDVAAIVAQNNAAEVLAKREREKAEKDAKKKAAAGEGPKQVRLRNAERVTTSFTFEEHAAHDTASNDANGQVATQSRKRKREVEVGLERFMAAAPSNSHTDGVLDRIASAIHGTIMAVPDIHSRSSLWDNMIILGNGSRVRGFTNALMHTLSTRYVLSPSNATIFTSELPSNFSTPVPTGGTNTPIPGQQHAHSHITSSGVNPLLVAATKNMMQPVGGHHPPNQHLQVPGMHHQPHMQHMGAGQLQFDSPNPYNPIPHQSYRGHSQTPTSIKTVKVPEYFPEWKDPSVAGMEDAAFLGAQVAAKVVFTVDQGASKGFLTRTEYNELGPEGVHSCCM